MLECDVKWEWATGYRSRGCGVAEQAIPGGFQVSPPHNRLENCYRESFSTTSVFSQVSLPGMDFQWASVSEDVGFNKVQADLIEWIRPARILAITVFNRCHQEVSGARGPNLNTAKLQWNRISSWPWWWGSVSLMYLNVAASISWLIFRCAGSLIFNETMSGYSVYRWRPNLFQQWATPEPMRNPWNSFDFANDCKGKDRPRSAAKAWFHIRSKHAISTILIGSFLSASIESTVTKLRKACLW